VVFRVNIFLIGQVLTSSIPNGAYELSKNICNKQCERMKAKIELKPLMPIINKMV
jgi:hypothetical protein